MNMKLPLLLFFFVTVQFGSTRMIWNTYTITQLNVTEKYIILQN